MSSIASEASAEEVVKTVTRNVCKKLIDALADLSSAVDSPPSIASNDLSGSAERMARAGNNPFLMDVNIPPVGEASVREAFVREASFETRAAGSETAHEVPSKPRKAIGSQTAPGWRADSSAQTDQQAVPLVGPDSVLHPNITCDNCEGPVRGIRYKCNTCRDYDLCSFCELIPGVHQEDHLFIKIKKPLSRFASATLHRRWNPSESAANLAQWIIDPQHSCPFPPPRSYPGPDPVTDPLERMRHFAITNPPLPQGNEDLFILADLDATTKQLKNLQIKTSKDVTDKKLDELFRKGTRPAGKRQEELVPAGKRQEELVPAGKKQEELVPAGKRQEELVPEGRKQEESGRRKKESGCQKKRWDDQESSASGKRSKSNLWESGDGRWYRNEVTPQQLWSRENQCPFDRYNRERREEIRMVAEKCPGRWLRNRPLNVPPIQVQDQEVQKAMSELKSSTESPVTASAPTVAEIQPNVTSSAAEDTTSTVPLATHSKHGKVLYMSAVVLSDESIPNATKLLPGSTVKKVWRVKNNGSKSWNGKTTIKCVWRSDELQQAEGDHASAAAEASAAAPVPKPPRVYEFPVPPLRPSQEGKLVAKFRLPSTMFPRGSHVSHWRLHYRGRPFGPRLACSVSLAEPLNGPAPAETRRFIPFDHQANHAFLKDSEEDEVTGHSCNCICTKCEVKRLKAEIREKKQMTKALRREERMARGKRVVGCIAGIAGGITSAALGSAGLGMTSAASGLSTAASGIASAAAGITSAAAGVTSTATGVAAAATGITSAVVGITSAAAGITGATASGIGSAIASAAAHVEAARNARAISFAIEDSLETGLENCESKKKMEGTITPKTPTNTPYAGSPPKSPEPTSVQMDHISRAIEGRGAIGQTIDGHGQAVDGQGQAIHGQGQTIDGQGQTVHGHGQTDAAPESLIEMSTSVDRFLELPLQPVKVTETQVLEEPSGQEEEVFVSKGPSSDVTGRSSSCSTISEEYQVLDIPEDNRLSVLDSEHVSPLGAPEVVALKVDPSVVGTEKPAECDAAESAAKEEESDHEESDHEEWAVSSSSGESSDEFQVIPIPECFDLTRPLESKVDGETQTSEAGPSVPVSVGVSADEMSDCSSFSDLEYAEDALTESMISRQESVISGQSGSQVVQVGSLDTPSEPPVSEPPVSEPPVSELPVSEPPVSEPPVSEPPVSEPPVSEPPVSEPLPEVESCGLLEPFSFVATPQVSISEGTPSTDSSFSKRSATNFGYEALPQDGSSSEPSIEPPGAVGGGDDANGIDTSGNGNGTKEESTEPSNTRQERENPTIHVLPETLVNGAMSAASHVINNVGRVLFHNNPQVC